MLRKRKTEEDKEEKIFGEGKNIFLWRVRTEKEKKADIMEKEKLFRDRMGGLVEGSQGEHLSDVHAFGILDLPMLAILHHQNHFVFYFIFFN